MWAAQADLPIGVITPMSTYRSNSFSTASCNANANGKVFETVVQLRPSAQRVPLPLYNAEGHLQTQLEIQRTRHFVYATQLHSLPSYLQRESKEFQLL
ncbi:hypothetical protein T07_912 [Trichinella nelsoni]|uniref:Uncharacterized protein n=1 Tax=Trichinella nelsoni TaxID=6336 RepID=A0A0V0RH50_9BILA|nr:hypothetical protein T07_912 [Trichinella nelsoni]